MESLGDKAIRHVRLWPGSTAGEVARRLGMRHNDCCRLLRSLWNNGRLLREKDQLDKRVFRYHPL